MTTILVTLPGGEGMIRGDDGEIALTHDVTLDRGQPLQPWDMHQPVRLALGDDRMLVGGLLPPGAVSVEAVEATGIRKAAAVGGGTYAVIFEDGEHGEPALGYRDATGGFVHRPLPADCAHQPITDAEDPCPVCGAVQYEQYLTTEEWRAGRGVKGTDSFEPSPRIVCRVCGHQEHFSVVMRLRGVAETCEDADARAARTARLLAEQAVRRRHEHTMTLRAVTFPIYAAAGWPARITGSGSHGDDLTSLRIAHAEILPGSAWVSRPPIEVTTSIDPHRPSELSIARDAFASLVDADGRRKLTGDLSDAAIMLSMRAVRRRRVAGTYGAPVGETEIAVDGAREPFVTVGAPNARWAAVRHHHDVTITVAARGIDPESLTIEPIADPNARLLGPDPEAGGRAPGRPGA